MRHTPTGRLQHPGTGGWTEFALARPAPALRGHVRRYTGYVEASPVPMRRREVPGADVTLIVSMGPRIRVDGRQEGSFVAALHDRPATTEFTGDQAGVQIDLTPPAARRLLGVPMHELPFPAVALEDVLGAEGRRLGERLADAPGWEERFALLDAVIAARLASAPEPPPELAWAWGRLVATAGRSPIGPLAAELGWSPRRLARGFRDHVGPTPKPFARILRFRRAVERLRQGGDAVLADVALECGYYDQAHFNRDFREFAGGPPGDYAARVLPDGLGVAGG